MALYSDDMVVLRTEYVVALTLGAGRQAHDGEYWLALILDLGGEPKRLWIDYPNQPTRDAAFQQVKALMMQDAGALEPTP